MEDKKFTIYSISTNGDVFYIGRTCNLRRRKNEHLRESHKKYNTYKVNKIRKLQSMGEPIEFNILHDNLTYEDSVKLEIEEVKLHKENNCKLTNLTEGGEGIYGATREFTEEWKDNLKKAKKEQFENGYIVFNKGKKLAEIVGSEQKANDITEKTKKTRKENFDKGLCKRPSKRAYYEPVNKGKKIEEIVSPERAIELRKISSETAKKTFTGKKQSKEHIAKRIEHQKETKNKWPQEQLELVREKNRMNGAKSKKMYKFLINNEHEFYGTWKILAQSIYEVLGIRVHQVSLSDFYRGKVKKLKCDIFDIKIIS